MILLYVKSILLFHIYNHWIFEQQYQQNMVSKSYSLEQTHGSNIANWVILAITDNLQCKLEWYYTQVLVSSQKWSWYTQIFHFYSGLRWELFAPRIFMVFLLCCGTWLNKLTSTEVWLSWWEQCKTQKVRCSNQFITLT